MYVYVCVYICPYTLLYLETQQHSTMCSIYVYACTCMCTYTNIRVYIFIYLCLCICIYKHIFIQIYIYINISTYICISICNIIFGGKRISAAPHDVRGIFCVNAIILEGNLSNCLTFCLQHHSEIPVYIYIYVYICVYIY